MEEVEIRAQVERLKKVEKGSPLLDLIPRVVAAGFGVVPLEAGEGFIEVATVPGVAPAALKALSRLLGREVRATPFREAVVHAYIGRLYAQEEGINFQTFRSQSFLEDPDQAKLLLTEKPFEPVEPKLRGDPGHIVLLDYAYKSFLWNLDGPAPRPTFEAGATELAFEVEPSAERPTVEVARKRPLPTTVPILARESYSTRGAEYSHGWRTHEISKLPFMIHPTELQITGVEADGALELLVYEDVVRVQPGETPRFDVEYCFLSMGQRLRRHLILKVYGLWSIERAEVRYAADPLGWRPAHLERWLGHDLALEPASCA